MRKGKRIFALAGLVATLGSGSANSGWCDAFLSRLVPSVGRVRPQDATIERRAVLLRSAILSKYAATKGAFRELDITDVVRTLIGTPADFYDASEILTKAGFSVDLFGRANPPIFMAHWRLPSPWYAIVPPAYDVYVSLYTEVPDHPSTIIAVKAAILRTDL